MEDMKEMFDSPESFQAHAVISYCYFRINQLSEESKQKPKSVIHAMIDEATGYNDHFKKERVSELKVLAKTIIENKKLIDADFSNDELFLIELDKQ